MNNQWYLAQTKFKQDDLAKQELTNQHYITFLPKHNIKRLRRQQVIDSLEPVFPGYIFINFDRHTTKWASINNTRGIRRLICEDRLTPTPIPNHIIDHLQSRCTNGVLTNLIEAMDTLIKPDQQAKVLFGPLTGQIGTCEWSDTARVRLLFHFLGQPLKKTFRIDQVELVDSI